MTRSEMYARPVRELTDVTVIWRDGQVLRTDWRGRTRVLRSIEPLDTIPAPPARIEALDAEVFL